MKKAIGVLILLGVLLGVFFIINTYIYQEKQADEEMLEISERDVHLTQFENRTVELAFEYPGGPDGYVLDDLSVDAIGEPQGVEVVQLYRLMNAKEKAELERSEGGREGPPAILLTVFANEHNYSPSVWVDTYPAFSNIELVQGEVDRDAVVGGANAVRYTTDGLYQADNVVVASGGYIYHFSGAYLAVDSIIHQDFQGIIDSVRFIQSTDATTHTETTVQLACEHALTYMLFQTGADADQFLTECIAGAHPEVIERYENNFGQDGVSQ